MTETTEATYDPFPRPGDPDFTSFPKHLSEDCIKYYVYVISPNINSESQLRSRLKEIHTEITRSAKTLFKDYIWHREAFSISLQSSNTTTAPVQKQNQNQNQGAIFQRVNLQGQTVFGDSIADEWAIVHLLRETSKRFKDAWIRVEDADGEFLLVEAANALPPWLNPEVAANRVWIQEGSLKIIPPDVEGAWRTKSKKSRPILAISLPEALEFLGASPSKLIYSPEMESEAFYRLRNYPNQICETFHNARITIPRKLAYVLHRAPLHISPAVEAFYLRDPISLRPLLAEDSERIVKFAPEDFVTTSVRFARVGYAQLKSQQFNPIPTWPYLSSLKLEQPDEKERAIMGMKVTSGFEMLLADPQNQDKRAVREIELLLEDLSCGEEVLPTDEDIQKWEQKEDDEKWLEVDFDDFEKELAGAPPKSGAAGDTGTAFGDKAAQDNLRRIVENFERFLNDDNAGLDGAEWNDDMDYDDEDDEDEESGSEREDNIPIEHEDFGALMAKIMKLSESQRDNEHQSDQSERVQELDSNSDIQEDEDIKKLSEAMEAELRTSGALDIDPAGVSEEVRGSSKTEQAKFDRELQGDDRFVMIKNMLESFKNEGGLPGPAGNMMRSMGLNMPRDESR